MKRENPFPIALLLAGSASIFGLVSCGNSSGLSLFKPPKIHNPNDLQAEEVTDEMAMGVDAIGASGSGGSFKAKFSTEDIASIEKSIVWAPTNPNEAFGLGARGLDTSKFETWTKNYKKAIAEARQTGKPILIWFSDSRRSLISQRLSSELFSRADFTDWVRKHYTTLLVDKAIDEANETDDRIARLKNYYEAMSERFSVKGTPEVLVIDFEGEVEARYRGYRKGEASHYWGRLKIAHENAVRSYGKWREQMERKGYRMWHSIDSEKKVFAKMLSATESKVSLVTPEGRKYNEFIEKFSMLDQKWIIKHRKLELPTLEF